jgi:hypothetical protein
LKNSSVLSITVVVSDGFRNGFLPEKWGKSSKLVYRGVISSEKIKGIMVKRCEIVQKRSASRQEIIFMEVSTRLLNRIPLVIGEIGLSDCADIPVFLVVREFRKNRITKLLNIDPENIPVFFMTKTSHPVFSHIFVYPNENKLLEQSTNKIIDTIEPRKSRF